MMQRGTILITGGTGYIASRLAEHCLSSSGLRVVLWVHADSEQEFARKRALLAHRFEQFNGRVEICGGDLRQDEPFAAIDPATINVVVHAAAVTRFNVEKELAEQVNTRGSEKVFQFCSRCPNITRVAYLSTVYTSGLRDGAVEEDALDGRDGFANHYESSKWEAEAMLLGPFKHLPWQIFRVATVVADDDDGRVGQYNAVHNTLKLLYHGLLPVLPGKPGTPLYFVTGRFVAGAIFQLLQNTDLRRIYHVSHTREESLSLGELIDTSFATFSRNEAFTRRRVMRPLYTDQKSFVRLAENVQGFGGAVMKQAVASVTPFSRQLFLNKDVKNARLVADLDVYRAPNQKRLFENICEQLVRTGWGRDHTGTARELESIEAQ